MVHVQELNDPAVKTFVQAVNAGDRAAFFDALTENATMSDDGTDRDLREWTDREIFTTRGHMTIESQSDDGRSMIVQYSNSTWGAMRTAWKFFVTDGKISRFETGQA